MLKKTANLILLSLTMLLLVLSACAPTIIGRSPSFPLDIDFTDPLSVAEVIPGETYYLTNSSFYADPMYFGFTARETNDLLGMDSTQLGDSVTKNVSREFSLREVHVPEGWEVGLYRVNARREVVDRDTKNRVYYIADNIHLFFSLRIPEGARPGVDYVRVTVEGKDNTTDQITLKVSVSEPES